MNRLKLAAYAICAVVLIYCAWCLYSYIDEQGYHRAAVEYQSKIDKMVAEAAINRFKELDRQDAANAFAKRKEADRIAEMQDDTRKSQEMIKELQREADQDPDRDSVVLGASSVQRIDKIR